jgi:signal transduction histidine kinase/ActR/RegA family two-component response regulator
LEKVFSNSTKVEMLLRETGFKALIVLCIVMSVVIYMASPNNIFVAIAFQIFWILLSIAALYKPIYSSLCAKVWVLFSVPMAIILILLNGIVPATLISLATIFPVMLTKGYWRIASVSLIASSTLLVPFSHVDYELAIWLRLSVTNVFVAVMVFLLAWFLEKALVDSLDKSDALKQALESERKAGEAQSVFLATMSHEIRTPMNGIIGLVDIVLSSDITEGQRPKLERVKRAGATLNNILNDILDHSKLTADKLVIEHVPISITQVISETEALFQTSALDKNIQLTTSIDEYLANAFMGDPTRIMQVLNNLVSNAIKFTANNGTVSLSLKVTDNSPTTQVLEFCVADSGIGISDESLSEIFAPFVQANRSITREYGGTGLGLHISKSLAYKLGGDIRVESKVDNGSQFYFCLSLEKTQQAALNIQDDTLMKSSRFVGRVLVVEDNEINRLVASEILTFYGLAVELVSNGMEAIEVTKNSHFDIIFMDLQMPNVDGFKATKAIRLRDKTTPIIAFSASVLKEDVEKTKLVGMNYHMAKPINRRELIMVLQKFVKPKI